MVAAAPQQLSSAAAAVLADATPVFCYFLVKKVSITDRHRRP